jgi:type II secretory pathway predicted ATPase ExeA
MNQDYDSMDCFALIMVGLPHMNAILEKPVHEALKQRIVVHYNYCGLSSEETANTYILELKLPVVPGLSLMKLLYML